jgi:arylsulfatase A-like enzyme/Tfp pilus assembly protein PilF
MKKRVTIVWFTAVIFAFLAIFSSTQAPVMGENRKPNVLLITLDTTRADRLGVYGYKKGSTPNLDAAAGQGVLFEAAFSQVPITLPSHCSIMTGTGVPYHKVRSNGKYRLPQEVDTLAEILKRKGYTTAAFIASFTLDSRFGLNQGFDVYNQRLNSPGKETKTPAAERKAEAVFRDFSQWFKTLGKNPVNPFFCWVHFYDPHEYYEPPEPYYSRFKANRYDGEIAYMDEYVGRVIERLKSRGVLQDTLVVIGGDHGEAFGEHGEWGHQVFCYEENIRVPLVIFGRGLPRGKRVTPRVDLMDIMPTILDYLGIPVRGNVQGISLLPLIKGKEAKKRGFYIESIFANEAIGCAGLKGWIEDDYKYIDLPHAELYYLARDPAEKNNLFLKRNFLAKKMAQKMRAYLKQYESIRFDTGRKLSADEIKHLASLGYISSAAGEGPAAKYPDPKDLIGSWSDYIKGQRLLNDGKLDEAVLSYKEAIRLNPRFSWPYARLAFLNIKKGNIEAARKTFKEGIRANAEDYNLKIDYAHFLVSQSESYDAFEVLKELGKSDSPEVLTAVNQAKGKIFLAKGNFNEALYYFQAVLKVEPQNLSIKKMAALCLFNTGSLPEALAAYREVDKQTGTDPEILFNTALIANKLGKYELSASYYERLLKIDADPAIYFNYSMVLASLGKWEKAIETMRKFMTIYPGNDDRKKKAQMMLEEWRKNLE